MKVAELRKFLVELESEKIELEEDSHPHELEKLGELLINHGELLISLAKVKKTKDFVRINNNWHQHPTDKG